MITIQRCILLMPFLLLFSCGQKDSTEPLLKAAQLYMIDSVRVSEGNQFFAKPSQVDLIGDRILAVSSFLTPGIWFIDVNSGEIKHRIVNGEILDIAIFPAAFDISEYPVVHILQPRLKSIISFDVEKAEFLKNIKLNFPEGKQVRTIESFFRKSGSDYLVELYPSNPTSSNYYSSNNGLIGIFDSNGEFQGEFLNFPEQLSTLKSPIMPYRTFAQSYFPSKSLVAFPSSGIISQIDAKHFPKSYLRIPLNSQYFIFDPQAIPRPFDSNFDKHLDFPSSHFFFKIVEEKGNLYIQSDMRDNKQLGKYVANSNIILYDSIKSAWYETKPIDQNKLGLFAGVIQDTLYFFEGSLKNSEAKYVKRAIVRAVED